MPADASIGDAFTCRCYSRLHWRWFRSRVTFLLDNMALSCSCTFHVLIGPHVVCVVPFVRFLLAHVSCCSCSSVTSSLDHVSYFYWSTWLGHNISRVFFYLTMCHDVVRPCVSFLVDHVSRPKLPTRLFLFDHVVGRICTMSWICIGPRVLSLLYTCDSLVFPRVKFLFNDVAYAGSTTAEQSLHQKNNSRLDDVWTQDPNNLMHSYIICSQLTRFMNTINTNSSFLNLEGNGFVNGHSLGYNIIEVKRLKPNGLNSVIK